MRLIDSYSTHTRHSPQSVYSRWADPAGWPAWDAEVREVSFEGPAKLGALGRMRPASGPTATFSITAFEKDRVFTNASALPGATLIFEHRVAPTADGSEIQVSVGVDGILAPLWQRILRKSMGRPARSSVGGLLDHLGSA